MRIKPAKVDTSEDRKSEGGEEVEKSRYYDADGLPTFPDDSAEEDEERRGAEPIEVEDDE